MIGRYKNNALLRNVVLLASGTTLGQVILICALPILTRLYGPADLGILAVYTGIIGVLSVAGCLRFDIAIPLAASDSDAVNLLTLALAAACAIAAALTLLTLSIPIQLSGFIGQPSLASYIWLLPAGVWAASIYSAFQFWAVRRRQFGYIAKTQIVRALGGSGTQIAFGIWFHSTVGLLFGHLLYGGLGSIGLARLAWKNDRSVLKQISLSTLTKSFKTWRRYPMYSVPEALLDASASSLPLIMIAALVSAEEAGYMFLALRVTSIPVGFIGGSLSRVYLSESADKLASGQLGVFTVKIVKALLVGSIVPFVVLAVAAPVLLPIVLGEGWARAGVLVSWMVPAMFLQFLVSPVSTALHATGNQRVSFLLQVGHFALLSGAIVVGSNYARDLIVEIFACAAALYYGVYLAVVLHCSRSRK